MTPSDVKPSESEYFKMQIVCKKFNQARDKLDHLLNWVGLEEGTRSDLEIIRHDMDTDF